MAQVWRVIAHKDAAFPIAGWQPKAGDTVCYQIQDETQLVTVSRGIHAQERTELSRFVAHPSGYGALEVFYYNTDPNYFEHAQAQTAQIYQREPDMDGSALEIAAQLRPRFSHLPGYQESEETC